MEEIIDEIENYKCKGCKDYCFPINEDKLCISCEKEKDAELGDITTDDVETLLKALDFLEYNTVSTHKNFPKIGKIRIKLEKMRCNIT